jgi:ArsR family transcriptional regulator, arsenate/arsenite/antimonite-responsive transcriptional repressor
LSTAEKVFEALSSTTRRRVLAYLSERPLSAGEIAQKFDMSQPAVSKHLSILEAAGLVTKRREGQFVIYGMERETLSGTLASFLQAVCPPSHALKSQARQDMAASGRPEDDGEITPKSDASGTSRQHRD